MYCASVYLHACSLQSTFGIILVHVGEPAHLGPTVVQSYDGSTATGRRYVRWRWGSVRYVSENGTSGLRCFDAEADTVLAIVSQRRRQGFDGWLLGDGEQQVAAGTSFFHDVRCCGGYLRCLVSDRFAAQHVLDVEICLAFVNDDDLQRRPDIGPDVPVVR